MRCSVHLQWKPSPKDSIACKWKLWEELLDPYYTALTSKISLWNNFTHSSAQFMFWIHASKALGGTDHPNGNRAIVLVCTLVTHPSTMAAWNLSGIPPPAGSVHNIKQYSKIILQPCITWKQVLYPRIGKILSQTCQKNPHPMTLIFRLLDEWFTRSGSLVSDFVSVCYCYWSTQTPQATIPKVRFQEVNFHTSFWRRKLATIFSARARETRCR